MTTHYYRHPSLGFSGSLKSPSAPCVTLRPGVVAVGLSYTQTVPLFSGDKLTLSSVSATGKEQKDDGISASDI